MNSDRPVVGAYSNEEDKRYDKYSNSIAPLTHDEIIDYLKIMRHRHVLARYYSREEQLKMLAKEYIGSFR